MEKVNINKASAKDLCRLIHIGKKRAEKIIANRKFKDIYELSKIAGLGTKRMEDIIAQGIASTKDGDFQPTHEKKSLNS